MRVKYPALAAMLDRHTVDTGRGVMAGFLVRCSASTKDLGYVWATGNAWRWRTPSGEHYGERSSQRAAVQVLREAYDVAHGPQRALPFRDEEGQASGQASGKASGQASRPQARPQGRPQGRASRPQTQGRPQAPPAAAVPPKQIVWSTQPDLTGALDAAFRRHSTLKK
jgi:hypothetical protein